MAEALEQQIHNAITALNQSVTRRYFSLIGNAEYSGWRRAIIKLQQEPLYILTFTSTITPINVKKRITFADVLGEALEQGGFSVWSLNEQNAGGRHRCS